MKTIHTLLACLLAFSLLAQIDTLNDEFNSPCSLMNWHNITQVEGWDAEHFEELDISETHPGELRLMPHTSAWYADFRAGYLFKELTGDFVITASVQVTNRAGQAAIPVSNYSLGGIMLRTPVARQNPTQWAPDQENYIFLSIGRGTSNATFQYEVKSTTAGSSELVLSPISTNTVLIRLIRKGNAVVVLNQVPGQDWNVHARYDRPDMPAHLQIGFVSYTDWPNVNGMSPQVHNNNVLDSTFNAAVVWRPDIIARYDYARFDSISLPAHLENLDFSDSDSVHVDSIYQYFAYDSQSPYPANAAVWHGLQSHDWFDAANWQSGQVPSATDIVVIDDCACAEVNHPIVYQGGTPQIGGLILRNSATLEVEQGAVLDIDLSGSESLFDNLGHLQNYGAISIQNSAQKTVRNHHSIHQYSGSSLTIH